MTDPSKHYSGILVVTRPGYLDGCARSLEARTGYTISVRDPDRDRMIVVLEADNPGALEDLHRTARLLPGVVAADPIVHYVDEEPDGPIPSTAPDST